MTGTAVLLDHGNKYIVLEEIERSQIDPALSISDYPATEIQNENQNKAISLVGFKEEEIDWDYGY
ncbi:hypothetical protein ACGTN9_07370 [Halobacillus sp. MO56]